MFYSIFSASAGRGNDEITQTYLLKQEYLTRIKEGYCLFCILPEVSGETSETGMTCLMVLSFKQFSLIPLFFLSLFYTDGLPANATKELLHLWLALKVLSGK